MLSRIQRFRTISNQPFLNRGTVRRGVFFVFLEFAAFEREKMLLHIFRAESGAMSRAPRRKAWQAQEPRGTRRVEDLNGRCCARLTSGGGELFKPQERLVRGRGLRGVGSISGGGQTLSSRSGLRRTWVRLGERGRRDRFEARRGESLFSLLNGD